MPEWDRDALRELRAAVAQRNVAAIARACSARALDDVLQHDDPVELDDEERWLWVEPSSREGWRDMAEFAATVSDPALGRRLERALQGRGAFRRFRAVLDEHPDELTRFHRFAGERQLGRARRWLADHGLRPIRQSAPD